MARTHGIFVLSLIALGTAAWFLVCQPEQDAPPLPEMPRDEAVSPLPTPVAPADGRMQVANPPDAAMPADGANRAIAGEPERTPDAASNANVRIVVRDRAHQTLLPSSTWRFVAEQADALRGEIATGEVELHLPPVRGTLLVECRGHRAESIDLTPPGADQPPLRLDVFLVAKAPATGVALALRTADGRPVARVRIDLWQLEASAEPTPENEDPRHEPLWKRQFDDVDGRFAIDELATGRYALRAQAVDEAGFALPLQPMRAAFEFHGHESVPLRADLAPGQVLRLQFDGDTTTPRQIALSVRNGTGERVSVPFRSVDADGKVATGYDVARVPGRVESLLALPYADYGIEAFLDEQELSVRRGGAALGAADYFVTLPR